ncbi:MAG: ATP-binding protein [Actinomycetota bacterium]
MKLRSAPLRVKLVTALLLPVLVVLGYLGLRVNSAFDQRQNAQAQLEEVEVFTSISDLSSAIGNEYAVGGTVSEGQESYDAAKQATDAAMQALRENPSAGADEIARVESLYAQLVESREVMGNDILQFRLAVFTELAEEGGDDPTVTAYTGQAAIGQTVASEYDFNPDAIASADAANNLRDVRLAQEASAAFGAEITRIQGINTLSPDLRTLAVVRAYTSDYSATNAALERLRTRSTEDVRAAVEQALAAEAWLDVDAKRVALNEMPVNGELPVTSDEIAEMSAVGGTQLAELEAALTQRLVDDARDAEDSANWAFARSAGLGLLLFVVMGLVLALLYRSIRNPLGRLTERSQEVAEVELPQVVAAMRAGDVDSIPEITPIVAETDDEIGELVHAFNGMHRTAIELAGEQAESRRVVADMFVNLGRRNQRLLTRMLKDLTQLERNEQNPDTLSSLYDIDHLATRMRRNAESLLILAGAGQARRRRKPVNLYDVCRAALAEVEDYQRVELDASPDVFIHGDHVADLTHLLAELIENALSFSPAGSPVYVMSRSTVRGFVIAIADEGIGMSAELLAEANERIRSASDEDETPSEFLGHFVVGRLAARHGIGVDLMDGVASGLVARVTLPTSALVDPNTDAATTPTAEAPAIGDAPVADVQRTDDLAPSTEAAPLAAGIGSPVVLSTDGPTAGTVPDTTDAGSPADESASDDALAATSSTSFGEQSLLPAADRPLAMPSPDLPLPGEVVVPPSPASLDELDPFAGQAARTPGASTTDESPGTDGTSESLTVFGSKRRQPGSQIPVGDLPVISPSMALSGATSDRSSVATTDAVDTTAAPGSQSASDDADSVRSSLSGFQTGIARADRED